MIENGDKIYIIQINMAEPDQNPEWDNCEVYQDRAQAERRIEWMKVEYGDQIEYRIDTVQFYTAA